MLWVSVALLAHRRRAATRIGAALVLKEQFLDAGCTGIVAISTLHRLLRWLSPGSLLDPTSGTVNSLLIELGILEAPINFLGQRSTDLELLGLAVEWPVALSSVIVFESWRYFPLAFLFILARMASISEEMYEAAEIDGATPFQQFRFLSLPMLAAILAVLFLLRFIWNFNKFDDIFLLTGGAAGIER